MEQQRSFGTHTTGTLYLVPTPIGNLADMTIRAVELLKTVDLIAAEDTRHTQMLLNHFEIATKTISFHEHNTQMRIPELLAKLQNGVTIAQVSDAGMPSISAPKSHGSNTLRRHKLPGAGRYTGYGSRTSFAPLSG